MPRSRYRTVVPAVPPPPSSSSPPPPSPSPLPSSCRTSLASSWEENKNADAATCAVTRSSVVHRWLATFCSILHRPTRLHSCSPGPIGSHGGAAAAVAAGGPARDVAIGSGRIAHGTSERSWASSSRPLARARRDIARRTSASPSPSSPSPPWFPPASSASAARAAGGTCPRSVHPGGLRRREVMAPPAEFRDSRYPNLTGSRPAPMQTGHVRRSSAPGGLAAVAPPPPPPPPLMMTSDTFSFLLLLLLLERERDPPHFQQAGPTFVVVVRRLPSSPSSPAADDDDHLKSERSEKPNERDVELGW